MMCAVQHHECKKLDICMEARHTVGAVRHYEAVAVRLHERFLVRRAHT